MPYTYHLIDCTLTAPGRGHYSVPHFMVCALDSDSAVAVAGRIVLCDRRTSDGILWRFAGRVERIETGDTRTFSLTMLQE